MTGSPCGEDTFLPRLETLLARPIVKRKPERKNIKSQE